MRNIIQMRKQEWRGRQQSLDENGQSRCELKARLNFVSDEFSLSRLTDSLSENRANNMFPIINEPTLEIKDTEQSHHLKIQDDISLERDDPQGLTARHSYQERSGNQVFLLEERVQYLQKELQEKNQEIVAGRKRNELTKRELERVQKELERAQKELDRTRKELQRKNDIIEGLQRQMGNLRLKQSSSDYQSRNSSSNSKSLIEESLQNFCPELLSPEETVQLLNQLLKKVSKSSKMMKSLTSDAATKDIITKINKN